MLFIAHAFGLLAFDKIFFIELLAPSPTPPYISALSMSLNLAAWPVFMPTAATISSTRSSDIR